MARENVLLKSESSKSLPEIAEFLRELADKVQSGNLTLKQGEEEVNLNLPNTCVLEVKVEEEPKGTGKKYQVEVEVEWKEGESEQEVQIA